MNAMAPTSPAATALAALTAAAMMVAMMLPSFAPAVWRLHRQLLAIRVPRAGRRTMLFAAAYAGVWGAMGLALFATGDWLSPAKVQWCMTPQFAPLAAGAVVLCAGALQRSRWKRRRLLRCREVCVTADARSTSVLAAWHDGRRFAIDCALSCAAPMAVLLVVGRMDWRMMVAVTATITAERVAPGGDRVARLTGGLALLLGVLMCVRATALAFHCPPCIIQSID